MQLANSEKTLNFPHVSLFTSFYVIVSLCFQQYGYTPLPFKSSMSSLRQSKVQKTKRIKQTPLHKKDVIVSSIFGDKAKKHSSGKVKPKLKAEVKIKNLKNDESDTIPPENIPPEESIVQNPIEVITTICRCTFSCNINMLKRMLEILRNYKLLIRKHFNSDKKYN